MYRGEFDIGGGELSLNIQVLAWELSLNIQVLARELSLNIQVLAREPTFAGQTELSIQYPTNSGQNF